MCQTALPKCFGSSQKCGFQKNRYVCHHSLVGGGEVVCGRQLPGGNLPGATILGAVDLLLDELRRRLVRLQVHIKINFAIQKTFYCYNV